MQKLVEAYRANPSLDNANKIRAYFRKHPMSTCMLVPADSYLVSAAIAHAQRGSD